MAISRYVRKGRKPVWLVHKVIDGKVFNKTFPFTTVGHTEAMALNKRLEDAAVLAKSIMGKKFYKDGAIIGLSLTSRKHRTKITHYLRFKLKIDGDQHDEWFIINGVEDFDDVFDSAISFIRGCYNLDVRDWVEIRKGIYPAFHNYKRVFYSKHDLVY